MKTIFTTLLFVFVVCQFAFSQVNKGFSYQTILRDKSRQLIIGTNVVFRMSILEDSPNGIEAYAEKHKGTTDEFGRVNFTIGKGEPLTGEFDSLDWENVSYYLQVEIDPKGGSDFILMGAAPLLAVPVADHARTATWETSDHDRDPENELQQISKQGDTITLSNGGLTVLLMDDDPTNEIQQITKSGAVVYLSLGGGTVTLNDDDAQNELQQITKSGNTISLSQNGGDITLNDDDPYNEIQDLSLGLSGNTLTIGNWASYINLSSFMDSPWTKYSSSRIYFPYQVGIGTSLFSGSADLTVGGNIDILSAGVNIRKSAGGTTLGTLGEAYTSNGTFGYLAINGTNGLENFTISTLSTNLNHGYIGVYGAGGFISVPKARMFIDASGKGVLAADIKYFVMEHPTQPGKEIWYACIEGPEAAAYERGTAQLTGGEAFIPFSDHFGIVANPETITVILTPLDANSEGLAVIEKSAGGIKIKELRNGTGNYRFDWEVKGVRKGYESFRVIRDVEENLPSRPERKE